MKTFFKLAIFILIIFLCIIISLFLWLNRPTINVPISGTEFEIIKGDTSYSVADRLLEEEYINSKGFFIAIVRIFGFDKRLKSGWFNIHSGSSTLDIISSLYGGGFVSVTFTIPEGSTIGQTREILIEKGVVSRDSIEEFLSYPDYPSMIGLEGYKSAEGFLFPETYKVFRGVSVEKVLSEMVDLFFERMEQIYPPYKNMDKKALLKKITLASILEKEVKVKEELPIVSGVFNNRLRIGMKLQSCATVQYVLGKPKEQLLESDLFIVHPYNTYLYKGLPPGPISSPGFEAIKSTFFPANHNYLFFVVKDPEKGSHHFSKTYEEHLEAQKKYKEIKGFN